MRILGDVKLLNSYRNTFALSLHANKNPLIPDMLKWKLLFDIKAQGSCFVVEANGRDLREG
jgi:hypothetical protein